MTLTEAYVELWKRRVHRVVDEAIEADARWHAEGRTDAERFFPRIVIRSDTPTNTWKDIAYHFGIRRRVETPIVVTREEIEHAERTANAYEPW